MVAPCEYYASDGEGDVEEHVEAEVGSEALVVARGIATLEYLENEGVSASDKDRKICKQDLPKDFHPRKHIPVVQSCYRRPTR